MSYEEEGALLLVEAAALNSDLVFRDNPPNCALAKIWRIKQHLSEIEEAIRADHSSDPSTFIIAIDKVKEHADEVCDVCDGKGVVGESWEDRAPCGCTGFDTFEISTLGGSDGG